MRGVPKVGQRSSVLESVCVLGSGAGTWPYLEGVLEPGRVIQDRDIRNRHTRHPASPNSQSQDLGRDLEAPQEGRNLLDECRAVPGSITGPGTRGLGHIACACACRRSCARRSARRGSSPGGEVAHDVPRMPVAKGARTLASCKGQKATADKFFYLLLTH